MARRQSPSRGSRSDRLNEQIRGIVGRELERLADDRLDLVTVTGVEVSGDLARARVFYSALTAAEEHRLVEVAEALDELRWPIQKVINRNVRARKTPQIEFEPDAAIDAGLRIDAILAGLDTGPVSDDVAADGSGDGEGSADDDDPR